MKKRKKIYMSTKQIDTESKQINLTIRSEVWPRRVLWGVIFVEITLVILDVFLNHFQWASVRDIQNMFNIAREKSIGTWFSSMQMLVVGISLFFIALAVKKEGDWLDVKRRYYGWLIIGSFFIYMAIDDAIGFHEGIGNYVNSKFKGVRDPGFFTIFWWRFPSYYWHLVFGPFFGGMGLFILYFIWKELKSQNLRMLIVSALALYVFAVVLDFFEGFYFFSDDYFGLVAILKIELHTVVHMFKVLEEFLEMLGTSFFLFAFLKHLFVQATLWRIEIK